MSSPTTTALVSDLARIVGAEHVVTGPGLAPYLRDATEVRGIEGFATAAVLPANAEQVAAVLGWCYERGVAIVPRGGGTGYAGGCVPQGGVVLALGRLTRVRSLEPLLWRARVEAGVATRTVQRLARENGLYFPPDPGAAEQSQIGGNIATNAGGPHAFKYGVTRAWVTGLEVVVPPGELLQLGGSVRKDVATYDLKSLLTGSEGTLGVITAADLRLIPAVEARLPLIAFYGEVADGCTAITAAMASGVVPATVEYLDGATLRVVAGAFPIPVPAEAAIAVIVEADGSEEEARSGRELLRAAMADGALAMHAPATGEQVTALWRWRESVGTAVDAWRGGKASEDIAVPLDRLEEAIDGTLALGRRFDLEACSWGHAGDGNLHSTFMFDRTDPTAQERVGQATDALLELALELGGTLSGEHGLGLLKSGKQSPGWSPQALALHAGVKQLFDPRGLLNPGKKLP